MNHSLLLGASADEDASREAGHEVAGDAETRRQKVPGAVLHAVLLRGGKKEQESAREGHIGWGRSHLSVESSLTC